MSKEEVLAVHGVSRIAQAPLDKIPNADQKQTLGRRIATQQEARHTVEEPMPTARKVPADRGLELRREKGEPKHRLAP